MQAELVVLWLPLLQMKMGRENTAFMLVLSEKEPLSDSEPSSSVTKSVSEEKNAFELGQDS